MQRTGLESRRLQHFRTVYERGSLSAAAGVLFVSQPALSSSISTLERQLGVRLFERTALGTRPTVYGEALYRRSLLVQAELQLAIDEIRALEEGRAGRVRIGAGPSVLELLAAVVARVLADRPNLVVALTEGPESQLLGAVRNGDLDLAVCTLRGTPADPEMVHEPLYTSITVPLVRRGHPLTRLAGAGWRDLARFPFVVADVRVEPLGQRILDTLSVHQPPTIVTANSANFMRNLVLAGDFVAIMPERLAHTERFAGRLVRVGPAEPLLTPSVGITTRARTHLSPAAASVIAAIRAVHADRERESPADFTRPSSPSGVDQSRPQT